MEGFPSQCVFNYDYQIVNLSTEEFEFLQRCDGNSTVAEILVSTHIGLDGVRSLLKQQMIVLTAT